MPEGDTLYRIAENLRPLLERQAVRAALSNASPTVAAIDAQSLVGRTVVEVRARGKHLFLPFDDGRVLHSHLGMDGSWHAYPIGEPWRKPARQAGVALRTATHEVVNFNPKLLRLVASTAIRRDDYLRRLGPDMMLADTPLESIVPRLRVHDATPIGVAVMNQTILAGVGNVYKSETLYLARLDPWSPVRDHSDQALLEYLRMTRRLMLLNRQSGRRTTRFAGDGVRHWVYARVGQPCFECEATVRVSRQGDAGRTTFWCPVCQAARGA